MEKRDTQKIHFGPFGCFGHGKERQTENCLWLLWLLWTWKRETHRKLPLAPLVALVMEKKDTQKIAFGSFGCFGHGKERHTENCLWLLWLLWSLKRETPRKFTLVPLLALVMEKRDTQKIHFGSFGHQKKRVTSGD